MITFLSVSKSSLNTSQIRVDLFFCKPFSIKKKKNPHLPTSFFFSPSPLWFIKGQTLGRGTAMCLCSGVLKGTRAKAQLAFGSSPESIRSLQKAAVPTFSTAGRQRPSRWLARSTDVLGRQTGAMPDPEGCWGYRTAAGSVCGYLTLKPDSTYMVTFDGGLKTCFI